MIDILWVVITILTLLLLVQSSRIIHQKRKINKTMDSLETMLEEAIEGRFSQKSFDESKLSALENKLSTYLSASVLSSHKLQEEKTKIEELITDISHQVKTSVANILLHSQLLEEQSLPPEAQKCIRVIHSQGEKLNFLMASLIKLSRLETGIFSFHPKAAPIQPMLEDLHAQFYEKAENKKLSLKIENTQATAFFDRKWTGEALANILDNALKYTPSSGTIKVQTIVYDLFCRIDIQDTGCGLAEEEKAKVFSRFYRSLSVSQEEGVGIGLYLAREIIAQQGGYIKLKSTQHQGSIFSVFIPLVK